MLKRFWDYIKALLVGDLEKRESSDILLEQAQREMTEVHARNRERAVQAITQKNNLQQMVDDLQKKTDMLQAKAELAELSSDTDRAIRFRDEVASKRQALAVARESLQEGIEAAEYTKVSIRREEEPIRQKITEALRMKAEWKNNQMR